MRDYPEAIDGLRFLQRRELPPVSSCWDYQVAETFSETSANRLAAELPEDLQITFFDPHADGEEAWVCVRRWGPRYLVQNLRHGRFGAWTDHPLDAVVALLKTSPLVKNPRGEFASFTVSTIPQHQRHDHLRSSH